MAINYKALKKAFLLLLFVVVFIYAIIQARNFLVPVAFGLLFSSLLYPACKFLCRVGVPRRIAIFIPIILMGMIVIGVSMFFMAEISRLAEDFPELKVKALDNVNQVVESIEEGIGIKAASQKNWIRNMVEKLFSSGSKFTNDLLNATAGTIFKVLIMPVFVFYLLYYKERFHFFIMRVVPDEEKIRTNLILKEISFVAHRYLSGAFIVVVILSVINSTGLYLLGLKYAILFGVISAICNLIPYFGTWIGAVFPFTFALLTGDSPDLAIWVVIFYAVVHFVENNILTPNITGGYVRLNPFITILGLIAGGMIWEVAGMLLVIPFLACLKIVFENFESTRSLAFLIGKPENEPTKGFTQRIKNLVSRRKTDISGNSGNNIPV